MVLSRLGIITDEVSDNLVDALDWAKAQQLHHVELRTIGGKNVLALSDDELQKINQLVTARNLFVSCVASPVFKCPLDASSVVTRGDMFGDAEGDVLSHFHKLDRAIEVARILRTRNVRIFSFWRESRLEDVWDDIVTHLQRAANVAREQGVVLLLENEPSCNGGNASEVAALVDGVNSPSLKTLWDPGNEAYGGRCAFPAGYNTVRENVLHIHLKDVLNSETGEQRCVPIGSGTVPFNEQFAALEQDGYQGLFTLEPHYIPEGANAMEGALMSLLGLKRLLAEAR